MTVRYGPCEGVDAGDDISVVETVIGLDHRLVPPILLRVVGIEHDEGTPEEAEEKVVGDHVIPPGCDHAIPPGLARV